MATVSKESTGSPRAGAEAAAALARAVEWLDSPWTRAGLAEAFGSYVEPARADELASRVIGLMPTEPVDREASLRAVLTELPMLSRVTVPLEPEWGGYRFGVVELPDHRAIATLLNVTLPELEWFADRGVTLRLGVAVLGSLVTTAPPKNREVEAAKARARAQAAWPARGVTAQAPRRVSR